MEAANYEQEFAFIKATLPQWKDLLLNDVSFERLSGITNVVFKVTTYQAGIEPNTMILRKYGKNGIIDRNKEGYVFELLGGQGLGPKSYGGNEDYRLEEYVPSRVIKPTEIKEKKMRRRLARAMGLLHKIDFPKLEKAGFFVKLLEEQAFFEKFNIKCNENIFTADEMKFIEQVRALSSKEEQEFVKRCLPEEEAVFCHNDLLNNNILVLNKTSDVMFIDVEYGNYNFRGFDMGNLFAEATIDYSIPTPPYYEVVEKNYPSSDDIIDFLRYYVVYNKGLVKDSTNDDVIEDEGMFADIESTISNKPEYRALLDSLVKQVRVGSMLSHYYWCVWAVVMSKNPDIDFDYIRFSRDRYNGYLKFKEELLNQEKI
jgi:thiamine kinase-like enzyme